MASARYPPSDSDPLFPSVYSVMAAGLTLSAVRPSLCVTSSPLCGGWSRNGKRLILGLMAALYKIR